MSPSTNNETPAEDTRTPAQKAADEALMYLRMAIRQINSGDYTIALSTYSTVPIPAGTNKAGLPKYTTGVGTLAITLEHGDNTVLTPFSKTPEEAATAAQPTEAKS